MSLSVFTTLAFAAAISTLDTPDPTAHALRVQAASDLRGALDGSGLAEPLQRREALQRAGLAASELLEGSRMGTLLRNAVVDSRWRFALDDPDAERRLVRDLRDLADDLRHVPRIEAALPAGFPPPTPVHEIERKRYPAYRMASAATRGSSAFWQLFQHIDKHEIAMTAPVETTWGEVDGRLRETRMAFLYAEPFLGTPGDDAGVAVVDVAPLEVVSLGCRGNATDERVAQARALLTVWLAKHPTLEPAGELRVLGYNSPMVRGGLRTYEVQLPVQRAAHPGPDQATGATPR